jgi:hypothetical protein
MVIRKILMDRGGLVMADADRLQVFPAGETAGAIRRKKAPRFHEGFGI